MPSANKTIILCADDFGLHHHINAGILALVAKKRLSAVSCLVNFSAFAEAPRLKDSPVLVGLHLNLTDGKALTLEGKTCFAPLSTLLRKALLGTLDAQKILIEFTAQMERFIRITGKLPDFLDGHQHIHQFPIIRDALLVLYARYYPESQAFVRVSLPSGFSFKKMIIALTGAKQLQHQLEQRHIPYNTSFSGIYSLKPNVVYRNLCMRFFTESLDQGLVRCHPGMDSKDSSDPIAKARVNEFNYLASSQFLTDCTQLHIQLK